MTSVKRNISYIEIINVTSHKKKKGAAIAPIRNYSVSVNDLIVKDTRNDNKVK